MTIHDLMSALALEPACAGSLDREVTGGYCGDLLSWVMGRAKPGYAWITIMCNLNTVAVAVMTEVSAVVFAEGVRPDEEMIRRAGEQGVTLLCSEQPAFELAGALSRLLEENR